MDSDLDLDLNAVDLDLDFLLSAGLGLGLKGSGLGLGLGYWWTCYKSDRDTVVIITVSNMLIWRSLLLVFRKKGKLNFMCRSCVKPEQ